MTPAVGLDQASIPPPSYHRSLATSLHLDALTLVTRLELLTLCRLAVQLAHRQCPPPLPAGPGGAPRVYTEETLLLLALLRTLWRLSYRELHDWLVAWPALALACGLPPGPDGWPRVPSPAQQSRRLRAAGAPASETLFVLLVRAGFSMGLTHARDVIIDSAPILAWRHADVNAAIGLAPAHHPRPLLRGYRLHTLLCRGTGLPLLFLVSRANVHDAPFARPLLELAARLFAMQPRVIRLDAGYWGLKLIAWIHSVLRAQAVIPWNPKRQKRRDGLPPTWTADELGKRTNTRALLRPGPGLLSPATPAGLWVVGRRDARGADLRGGLGDRLGSLAGPASRSHPLTPLGPGSCLGGDGDVKRLRTAESNTPNNTFVSRRAYRTAVRLSVDRAGGQERFGTCDYCQLATANFRSRNDECTEDDGERG